MAKVKKAVEKNAEENVPQGVILVEIENVALKGRQLFYDVLKKVLKDKNVELDMSTFTRCCLDAPARQFVPCLLKSAPKARLSEDKLLSDVLAALKHAMSGSIKVESAFKDLIRIASEKKVLIGGLSSLDKDATVRILAELGLPDMGGKILSCVEECGTTTRVNTWLQLAKNMSMMPSQCVVVATSATSCRSAVAARMRCAVIPDRFTSFQDFGGANVVLDALDKEAVGSILDLVKSTTA